MSRRSSALIYTSLLVAISAGIAHADDPTPTGAPAPAQIGTVRGRLLDASTQEGLPAAAIRVLGGQSLATELDGTYALSLPPGTYTLVFSTPEYVEQRRTITVSEAQALALELALAPAPRGGQGGALDE